MSKRRLELAIVIVASLVIAPRHALVHAAETEPGRSLRAPATATAPVSEHRLRRFFVRLTERERELIHKARALFDRARRLPPPPRKLRDKMQSQMESFGELGPQALRSLSRPTRRHLATQVRCTVPAEIEIPAGTTQVRFQAPSQAACTQARSRDQLFKNHYIPASGYEHGFDLVIQNMPISVEDAPEGRDGLMDSEFVAILGYTADEFRVINRALRNGDRSYDPYIQSLNSGLDKLPDHVGEVHRGGRLPPASLAEHTPGAVVTYPAFTSTSTGYGFEAEHRFIIFSKHGKAIWTYSFNPEEREVLFKAPTRFVVLERREAEGGLIEFTLRELEPGENVTSREPRRSGAPPSVPPSRNPS